MATGLPVIAASGGAVPENIEDGVTGTLVPVNNSEALAEAINSTLEKPQYSEIMAKASKSRVQQKFSWDRAAENMIEIYKNIRMKIPSI
jgi:glycosyltransferase involved in cell wall biosynthesis